MGIARRLKFLLLLVVLSLFISFSKCDIQPIDVEPVMKREQPDFEDDTGFAAVENPAEKGDSRSDSQGSSSFWNTLTNGTDMDFTHAFVASLSIIIVSELGDKTFFIAAIMAMTNPRITVFAGAMTALAFMHILSALFGYIITYIPRIYTFYASAALFIIFGLKMIREGCKMKSTEAQEELEEVQMDLRKREEDEDRVSTTGSLEEGVRQSKQGRKRIKIRTFIPKIFLEALTLTFLAEWGDRSQIATVVLAASNDVYGIIVGGLLGHFLCTGLAVVGGKLIAARISIRTVTIIGGIVFLIFAATAFIMGP